MTPERWQELQRIFSAALDADPAGREKFIETECAGDAELAASVRSLLSQATSAEDQLRDIVQKGADLVCETQDTIPNRIGSYQILEAIGSGGMGSVYRAVRADGLFDQKVAIKLLRTPLAVDALFLQRFLEERRILARMEHPNIARLIDGGVTSERVPYLVMEYVDGKPIDVFCNERNPALRERLRLFREICSAVQYAHQNLVVHRDLKPANILVTSGGAVKLLDFGVAKFLETDRDITQTGMTLMTLEYASPEQVRGGPITTSSDIYALGLLLYELLTGKRAQTLTDRSPTEIVKVICEQDPPRPSIAASRRDLSGDIDNIVMKALQKEPERRYSSVEQMREDIHRYLSGLPVSARPSTFTYRAAKFVRRNLPASLFGAAAIIALVVGTFTTIRQAGIAQRRFSEVRTLANSVVFEFDPALANLPGSTPARRLIIDRAIKYLNNLAREAQGTPELEAELAAAYEKVAAIQGNPSTPNLGDVQGALDGYRKAIALRENLLRARPRDLENRASLVDDYGDLGSVLSEMGDAKGAMSTYQKALDKGADVRTLSANGARRIAGVYLRVAELTAAHGTMAAALDHYRTGVRVLNEAAQKFPNVDFRKDQAVAFSKSARALQNGADLPHAVEYAQRAFELRESIANAAPNNLEARRDVWLAHLTLGDVLGNPVQFSLNKTAEALDHYQKAMTLAEEAAASDPKSYRAQRDLMVTLNRIGDVLDKVDRKKEALASYRRAFDIVVKLEAIDHRAILRRDMATGYDRVGGELIAIGETNAGIDQMRKGLQIRETLAQDAKNTEGRRDLMLSLVTIGPIVSEAGRHEEALDLIRRGLVMAEDLSAADSADALSHRYVAVASEKLATALVRRATARPSAKDWTEARSMYQHAIAALDAAAAKGALLPSDKSGRAELVADVERCDRALQGNSR